MHIPRFFLTSEELGLQVGHSDSPLDLSTGQSVVIENKVVANQIINVLRLKGGDRLIILDGLNHIFYCHIDRLDKRSVRCIVDEAETAPLQGDPHVTVALAVLKGDRFEWCLQKLTELGVAKVVPLMTSRTVVKVEPGTAGDAKGQSGKLTRWQAIAREAAEQSERVTIPHIVPPKKLEDFISSCARGGAGEQTFICAERLSTTPLKDILLEHVRNRSENSATADKTINLIIGPEGGFTETELQFAQDQGVEPVSLGRRILRSETAAIYALAQVMWCLEK